MLLCFPVVDAIGSNGCYINIVSSNCSNKCDYPTSTPGGLTRRVSSGSWYTRLQPGGCYSDNARRPSGYPSRTQPATSTL
eukprot:scaffold158894_cov16-Prasinocladus_malaysianus.AAC.1